MATWRSTKVIASLIISRRVETDPKNLPPPDVSQRGSASDADVYSAITKNLWFSYLTTATKCYSDSFLICLLRSYSELCVAFQAITRLVLRVICAGQPLSGKDQVFWIPLICTQSFLLQTADVQTHYRRLWKVAVFCCCCFNAEIHFQSSMLLKSDWIAEFGSLTPTVETFDHIFGYTASEG